MVDPIRMWTDYLMAALVEAQKKRQDPHFQQWMKTPEGDHEFAWVLYERAQMLHDVNKARVGIGRDPVSVDAVRAVERQAEGHSDYTRKFALGCADLILGSGVDTP